VTRDYDKFSNEVIIAVIEDALKTDPWNYDLTHNIKVFQDRQKKP